MHDGGAEGFLEPEIFEDAAAEHFIQVSKQKTFGTKIRGTVKRLHEFGRKPKSLTYISSETVPAIDQYEETLSDELTCRIRILDAKYIQMHVNDSDGTIAAFLSFLEPAIAHFVNPGAAPIAEGTAIHSDKTLAVFLRQEVDHRQGKTELLESVADSLIIWALSDTDPDKRVFMDRDAILNRIEETLPSAKQFIRGVIDTRLLNLRTRHNSEDRAVRYYSTEQKYCLPFETRELIKEENVDDTALKSAVTAAFERRCQGLTSDNERSLIPDVVTICHTALERVFERQGLQVAQFAHNGEEDDELYANVADLVAKLIDENHALDDRTTVRRIVLAVLRGTFYDPSDDERAYLQKLGRTYVLLLLLKNEPKIVEYFKSISSKFILYIGTDFLVRALSEHYLEPQNQTTHNLFKILHAAGAKLILTEKAVEEFATHIRSQIFEFQNYYEHVERHVTLDAVEYIDRILIRSYFYSRLAPLSVSVKPPVGWRSYVDQFASYTAIRNGTGDQELARYLINKFKMEYETVEEMRDGLDLDDVEALSAEIVRLKTETQRTVKDKVEILAKNDALQVHRVYQRRKIEREGSPANPFGFRTWWLTQDATVRRAAGKLVASHKGQRFMMRPEFLLNFISFAPSATEVLKSYRTIFPSVLGIRLSNRLHSESFKNVMEKANAVAGVDDARAASMITDCVNSLKGDSIKVYETKW